jgi:two-component system, OmpR family, phosphate regulon sensor histidine kinase PhoR
VIGAVAFWAILGQAPWLGFIFYFSAHFSAIALIAPIVLVPLRVEAVRPREELATVAALVIAVSIALVSGGSFATASLVFPIMAWSALRGRPLVTVGLVVAVGIVISTTTAWGFGPFSEALYSSSTTATVQLFLLSIAITVLSIVSVKSERAALRAEAERRTQLLEGGFIASQVGLAVVRRTDSGRSFDVLEENVIAHELLGNPVVAAAVQRWATGTSAESSTEVAVDDGRALEIYASRLSGVDGDQILGIQIVNTTDAVAVRESLKAVVDEQRALSLRKQAFIARISHEFRTPITTIIGFTDVLQETASAEQARHLAAVARSAARLQGLTEELLSASVLIRSDAVGRHDLSALMMQAAARAERRALDRSVTIAVDDAADCIIDVAPAVLSRFLDRLFERAIESSPADSIVSARSHVDDRFASVTISDSGAPLGVETTIHFAERLVRAASESSSSERHLPVGVSEAVAELFGCELAVDESPFGGISVRLQFERASSRA